MTEFQAWKLKMIEAKLFDKLGDETEKNIYSPEYEEARVNWITAFNAVTYFTVLFQEVMKSQHV
jgi:hypothetical protein